MTRRVEQLASTLQREIQACIDRGLQDPRVSGLITITGVRVSPDRRAATVHVSIFPEDRQELCMHGLRAAAAHIRHDLSNRIDVRRAPDITFKLDESLKKQAAVFEAINNARKSTKDAQE